MNARREINLTINETHYTVTVEARRTLVDVIRDDCGLTGTHIGCEHGVCGACTILLNGLSTRSCLTFAVQANGQQVTTIEGLAAPDGTLSPLQQAMADNHGLQCGFCTPGMLITLTELLRDDPNPDDAKIRETITGNLCRCTGYSGIVAAARQAARHGAGG